MKDCIYYTCYTPNPCGQNSDNNPSPEPPATTLPFIQVSAAHVVPNDDFEIVENWTVVANGGLLANFDATTGIFTAPTAGLYQFSAHVVFQLDHPNTVAADGERLIRLVRSGDERTFIGQYHYVPPDSVTGTRNAFVLGDQLLFFDPLTVSATINLAAGETVRVLLYQNNQNYLLPANITPQPTGGATQVGFTELVITKLNSSNVTVNYSNLTKKAPKVAIKGPKGAPIA